MKHASLIALSAAMFGLSLAGPAAAQAPQTDWRSKRAKAMIERLDTNKDGRVSRAEFAARRQTNFARADTNRDGALDRAERRNAFINRMIDRRMARLDANKDGRLTVDEMTARGQRRFQRLDANKDGVVTRAEIRAAADARRQRMEKRRAERRARMERRRAERRAERGDRANDRRGAYRPRLRRAGRADINRDGKISRAEYGLMTNYMFLRLDQNQDGVITFEEARNGLRRKRGHRGGHRPHRRG